MIRLFPAAVAALAALSLASHAAAGGPHMALGVAEDLIKSADLVHAKAHANVLRLAGFQAVRVTTIWTPGQVELDPAEATKLRNVVAASRLTGLRVYLLVYHAGSRTTPLTPEARAQFAAFSAATVRALPGIDDVIVGNEPNLNRFWLPQFNPDGTNAAAPAYLALLAAAYDAIKAASPAVHVWGGALASRGNDRRGTGRDTHSPTRFIRDLGAAYRASGRQLPVMDGFAHHPYPGDSSRSPEEVHANSTTIGLADYDRLVELLGQAFDGTAQPGSSLPILYDEFGIESVVPRWKARSYTGTEPATTKPVAETQQADSYGKAIRLAFCQPNVEGIFLFHSHDEPALASWQSGVFYADGTPKASLVGVRDAISRARGGSIARCEGLELPVEASAVRYPTARELRHGPIRVRFRCDLDCAFTAKLMRGARVVRSIRSYARGDATVDALLSRRGVGAGRYRVSLTLEHPLNPAGETVQESRELAAG